MSLKLRGIDLQPDDLGFQFPAWRDRQLEIAERIANSPKKIVILQLPTGGGKSVIPLIIQRVTGRESLVLTRTKMLQYQYEEMDILGLYGRSNYICNRFPTVSAAEGVCHIGQSCGLKYNGCDYYDQKKLVAASQIGVLNYSYFFTEANNVGDFSGRDWIICDEAHSIPNELSNRITIKVSFSVASRMGVHSPRSTKLSLWKKWAENAISNLEVRARQAKGPDLKLIINLRDSAEKIISLVRDDNFVIVGSKFDIIFRPIWVDAIAEEYLWRHGNRFLFMSATINPKEVMLQLGKNPDDAEFIDVPSSFPVKSRLIYYDKRHRINYKSTDVDIREFVKSIDGIIDSYQGKRGLIHTGSYKLATAIYDASRNKRRIITHTSDNRELMLESFKKNPEAVLITPSMTEGVDLPYDLCRFQIIKIGFPNRGDPVWAARFDKDKIRGEEAYTSETINNIVQAYGRGMRAIDDNCETWILDGNLGWLLARNSQMFPVFFKQAIVQI